MRLAKLSVTNFGCIGSNTQEIFIDDIVVLIGPNDCGKSTLLDAYEAFASTGKIQEKDRYHKNDLNIPIVIEGLFCELSESDVETLGQRWVHRDEVFGDCVRARYVWKGGGDGKKESYNPETQGWDQGGLGGWDSLLTSRIPVPLRLRPSSSPEEYEDLVRQILIDAVKAGLKEDDSHASRLLDELKALSEKFSQEVASDIEAACNAVGERIARVFPGYKVGFIPDGGKVDVNKLVGAGSFMTIDDGGGHQVSIVRRGTGVQRSFLWSALSALADLGHMKIGRRALEVSRPRMLLVDEPESFLHPPAVRRASASLYGIAELNNWQVMVTTHSPVFIDITRPHTTLVRVNHDGTGAKVFQTSCDTFDVSESESLKMIRMCHPTVNEFFMADRVFLVEGDTEDCVLSFLLARSPESASNACVVNCRGKANLPTFMKILNQFGLPYVVVHDSDSPKCRRQSGIARNSAWTTNEKIVELLAESQSNGVARKLYAHVPNFESHYFDRFAKYDKPNSAILQILRDDFDTACELDKLRAFGPSLISGNGPNYYSTIEQLKQMVTAWVDSVGEPEDSDIYRFD